MSTQTLLIGLSIFAAGIILGFILARTLHPKERERKELETQLKKSQEQVKDYQDEVTEHFMKTSELVNNMSKSYRNIHEHLATGAMRLTNTEISRQMIDAGFGRNETAYLASEEIPEPPKDYAPKVPGGILSESYGLKEEIPRAESDLLNTTVNDSDIVMGDDNDDPTQKVG